MSILFLLYIFKAINYYIVPPERRGHCKRENSYLGFINQNSTGVFYVQRSHVSKRVCECCWSRVFGWHNRDIVISFNFSLYVYIIRNCGILNSMAPSYRDLRKVFSSFSNSWNKWAHKWYWQVCIGATSFQEYFYLIIECFYLGFFLLSLHILD